MQNFEYQCFFYFSEKINIFCGMKILWIFLGDHHKTGLVLGVISTCLHIRVFS